MKRAFKVLIPVFLFALAISLFQARPASAASNSGFAVYASEEEYIANKNNPAAIYSDGDLYNMVDDKGFAQGYVLCYGDVYLNQAIKVASSTKLTIDLGGNTLTMSDVSTSQRGYFRIGEDSKVTPTDFVLKNGTLLQESGQSFKPQNNSRVYFDNLDIKLLGTNGSCGLLYATATRMIYFKDCTVDLSKSSGQIPIIIYSIKESNAEAVRLNEGIADIEFDYVHNIVFDNTLIKNGEFQDRFIYIPETSYTGVHHYEIAFLPGSSFERIDEKFFEMRNTSSDSYALLTLSKGMKFKSKSVPIAEQLDEKLTYGFYNSVAIDGMYVSVSGKTELAAEGDSTESKLRWGASDDASLPYQLCNYLCTVEWYVPDGKGGYSLKSTGEYADGVITAHKITTRGFYSTDTGIYSEQHLGWSSSPGGEYTENVTITKTGMQFYAVIENEGPATVVEYKSNKTNVDNINSILTGDTLTVGDFYAFKDGAYVKLLCDVKLDFFSPAVLEKTLTLDLGGKTLSRSGKLSGNGALFNLSGGSLNVIDGQINLSMLGLAVLDSDASLTLRSVSLMFDTVPPFVVNSGKATLSSVNITKTGYGAYVPVFTLAKGGNASVVIDMEKDASDGGVRSKIDTNGVLFTYIGSDSGNNIDIKVSNTDITAESVFALYSSSLDKVNTASVLNIELSGCNVDAPRVFSVPRLDDGTPALLATFSLSDSSFSSNPALFECGTLVLPRGVEIIYVENRYVLSKVGLGVLFSFSVESSLTANFYLPATVNLVSASTYKDSFLAEELEKVFLEDGTEYYRIGVDGISPSAALEDITVILNIIDNEGRAAAATVKYSPVSYFDKLLQSEDLLTLKLTAATMRYLKSAYEYDGIPMPESFELLCESEAYATNLRDVSDIPEMHEELDLGNIGDAFSGAQLYLSNELYIRFNIKEGLSGTLMLDSAEYTAENGLVNGKAYIDFKLSPRNMYMKYVSISGFSDGVTIKGEYSLEEYLSSLDGKSDASRLLLALYGYCYEAYVYINRGTLPPYVDNSPMVDLDYVYN